MNAARSGPLGLDKLKDSLGPRDFEVISEIRKIRVATTTQIQRLLFYSGTPLSNARVCRRTLERLTRMGVVVRLDRRIGGARAGSAGFVYALGVSGHRLAGAESGRLRRPSTPSSPYLRHALAVTEVLVRLTEAARDGRFELRQFEAEPDCWRRFTGGGGELITLKPDGFVRLTTDAYVEHAFLEVDLNTESSRALSIKFDRYRDYWATGREQARHEIFPRVVWLVPDRARYDQVVEVASRQPPDAWQLFKVAEFDGAVGTLGGDGV